jgi:hypothetical protein
MKRGACNEIEVSKRCLLKQSFTALVEEVERQSARKGKGL